METNTIIKRAKLLNYVEIALTVILFVLFQVLNAVAKNVETMEELNSLLGIQYICLIVSAVISVVVIICTAILMSKNQKRVNGLGLLLAAGIVTLIFSLIGAMLGIVIWVLCGLSLNKLKQKKAEDQFEAQLQNEMTIESQLQNEMNVSNPTNDYAPDNFQ
ncbi:MAG: hypothetical protein PUE95_07300 [Lachnospiraceae bacterium]|nr:hypothetical protein [Lachnospiraceae bacterium]